MLSNTCKYGLRAVIYLALNARNGEKIGIKKISSDLQVPSPFLGKILQSLAKQKLLDSTKGPNGGFGLGKDPAEIFLMDIVAIIDGDDNFRRCAIGNMYCEEQDQPCALHSRYAVLRDEMKSLFQASTLAEVIADADGKAFRI